MKINDIITEFLKSKDADPQIYDWDLDHSKLPCSILIKGDSIFEQNIALKYELSRLWKAAILKGDDPKLLKLVNYVVSTWGGVHTNHEDTLKYYILKTKSSVNQLIDGQKEKGIASWSKILCFSDPEQYAIFDARVALSLNALQIMHKTPINNLLRFPSLSPRNKKIQQANSILSKYFKNHGIRKTAEFYNKYLNILKESRGNDRKICEVEMLLFSAAPHFATKIIQSMAGAY